MYEDMAGDLKELSLDKIRAQWAKAWEKAPHGTMGRTMMIKSLEFKRREQETGGLSSQHRARLDDMIKAYKRNPESFDKTTKLKPGTRLVRSWKGEKHHVTVTQRGFEYEGNTYTSLSHIANIITGSRWNGWLFFGLKK